MKYINTKINIVSFYYRYKVQEHETFIEFSRDFNNSLHKNAINIIGQDSNAEIGISNYNDKLPDCSIGKYDEHRSNRKGYNLLHMIQSLNWYVLNTMFEHNICTTWKDFSHISNRCYQIDRILTND